MITNMNITFILIVTIVLGIINASYLYWQGLRKQRHGLPMVCPVGGKCENVVFSRFGTTLGVKNEILGLFYYFSLLILVALMFFLPHLSGIAIGLLLLSSGFALVFSTYLLFVQILVLRDYCSWCILATFINYAIFGVETLLIV